VPREDVELAEAEVKAGVVSVLRIHGRAVSAEIDSGPYRITFLRGRDNKPKVKGFIYKDHYLPGGRRGRTRIDDKYFVPAVYVVRGIFSKQVRKARKRAQQKALQPRLPLEGFNGTA